MGNSAPKKNSANEKSPQGVFASNPEKVVPKLCNRISLAKDQNGNIILALFFIDPSSDQHILIDRILLDKTHSAEVARVLNEIIAK